MAITIDKPLGFLSTARNVAGSRVMSMAVTSAGTMKRNMSCNTAAMRIIGTDDVPAL
jgi:hypothetical protein